MGEESARIVREEMEKMWGDTRMVVLAEDEAQKWILGVTLFRLLFFLDFVTNTLSTAQFQETFSQAIAPTIT